MSILSLVLNKLFWKRKVRDAFQQVFDEMRPSRNAMVVSINLNIALDCYSMALYYFGSQEQQALLYVDRKCPLILGMHPRILCNDNGRRWALL